MTVPVNYGTEYRESNYSILNTLEVRCLDLFQLDLSERNKLVLIVETAGRINLSALRLFIFGTFIKYYIIRGLLCSCSVNYRL